MGIITNTIKVKDYNNNEVLAVDSPAYIRCIDGRGKDVKVPADKFHPGGSIVNPSYSVLSGEIEELSESIDEIKAKIENGSVWLTENEYKALEDASEIDPDVEYNIYDN